MPNVQSKGLQMTTQTPLSNCCNTLLKVISGDEGTSYYECTKCQKPADPTAETPLPKLDKDVEERYESAVGNLRDDTGYFDHTFVKNFLAVELQKARDEERERLYKALKQKILFSVSGKPMEVEWADVKKVFTQDQETA